MLEGGLMDVEVGMYVQLDGRESPFAWPSDWWWRVVRIGDAGGLDVVHEDGRTWPRRFGVPPEMVRNARQADR